MQTNPQEYVQQMNRIIAEVKKAVVGKDVLIAKILLLLHFFRKTVIINTRKIRSLRFLQAAAKTGGNLCRQIHKNMCSK